MSAIRIKNWNIKVTNSSLSGIINSIKCHFAAQKVFIRDEGHGRISLPSETHFNNAFTASTPLKGYSIYFAVKSLIQQRIDIYQLASGSLKIFIH